MKWMRNFGIFLIICGTQAIAADRRFLAYMGGGGDPQGLMNVSFGHLGDFIQESNWNTQISYNGANPSTAQILRQKNIPQQSFSPQSYETIISNYERMIETNEIGEGDQLLLMFNSHGGEAEPGLATHSISSLATDQDVASANRSVSLDRLKKLTQLAEQRGIRLAIVDTSCHSGLTQSLANSNTCVISSTGPDMYANGNFEMLFTDSMKPGRNLEELFHRARREAKYTTEFPMISSPVATDAQNRIYPMLARFQLVHSEQVESKFATDVLKTFLTGTCSESFEFQQIQELADQLESVTSQSLRPLRSAIEAYRTFRSRLLNSLRALPSLNVAGSSRPEQQFCGRATNPINNEVVERCATYSNTDLLGIDFDPLIRNAQGRELTGEEAIARDAHIHLLMQAKQWRDYLQKTTPELAPYRDFFRNYSGLVEETTALARAVTEEQKKVYSSLVEGYRDDPRPNPCRDFVL